MKSSLINHCKIAALSVALPLALMPSTRAAVSLNFNLSDLYSYGTSEQILDYYNGGTDAGGATGPNYGISFGPDALALQNYPNSNVGNEPDGGDASMIFLSGSGDVMNVASGFTTGFSFYESTPYGGSVSVYSGLNDTGTLLASLSLPISTNFPSEPYYGGGGSWDPVGVSFAGTAESVDFSGTANYIAFADVTLGSENVQIGNGVPDTTGMSLYGIVALALAGMAWSRRKTKALI